jgi:hypothetical protein
MKNFTKILMLVIALLVTTGSVMAQNSADLTINISAKTPQLKSGIPLNADINLVVYTEKWKASTGVTVTAELPEGITPSWVVISEGSQEGSCAFEGSLIVCNFPTLGYEGRSFIERAAAVIGINLQPGVAGLVNVSATITGNEPDPNPANNSLSSTVTVISLPVCSCLSPKNRKRARFF